MTAERKPSYCDLRIEAARRTAGRASRRRSSASPAAAGFHARPAARVHFGQKIAATRKRKESLMPDMIERNRVGHKVARPPAMGELVIESSGPPVASEPSRSTGARQGACSVARRGTCRALCWPMSTTTICRPARREALRWQGRNLPSRNFAPVYRRISPSRSPLAMLPPRLCALPGAKL